MTAWERSVRLSDARTNLVGPSCVQTWSGPARFWLTIGPVAPRLRRREPVLPQLTPSAACFDSPMTSGARRHGRALVVVVPVFTALGLTAAASCTSAPSDSAAPRVSAKAAEASPRASLPLSDSPTSRTPPAAGTGGVTVTTPAGSTTLYTDEGAGTKDIGSLPTSGTLSLSLWCGQGAVTFSRPPDVLLRADCVGRPTGISVAQITRSRHLLRVITAPATSWRVAIGMSG